MVVPNQKMESDRDSQGSQTLVSQAQVLCLQKLMIKLESQVHKVTEVGTEVGTEEIGEREVKVEIGEGEVGAEIGNEEVEAKKEGRKEKGGMLMMMIYLLLWDQMNVSGPGCP